MFDELDVTRYHTGGNHTLLAPQYVLSVEGIRVGGGVLIRKVPRDSTERDFMRNLIIMIILWPLSLFPSFSFTRSPSDFLSKLWICRSCDIFGGGSLRGGGLFVRVVVDAGQGEECVCKM